MRLTTSQLNSKCLTKFDPEEDRRAEARELSEIDLNYRYGEGDRACDMPHRTMADYQPASRLVFTYYQGQLSVNRHG